MAKRSYPRSEVRGSGLECQAVMAQERLRGATLRPRSVAAGRSHITPEARGGGPEEDPAPEAKGGGQEEQPEELWLHRRRRA